MATFINFTSPHSPSKNCHICHIKPGYHTLHSFIFKHINHAISNFNQWDDIWRRVDQLNFRYGDELTSHHRRRDDQGDELTCNRTTPPPSPCPIHNSGYWLLDLSPFWSPSICERGPLSPWVNWTRILKSLYTGRKTYKTHSNLAHIYHKSLAELWFTFAERDIPHKSVFNTWKLSKKWPLG